jgi:surfactin synthase thioesterase subunit
MTATPVTFLRFGAQHPRRRLFCLPFAGGGAAPFRAWARSMPEDVEILAAQLPGREARLREAPFRSIAAMTQAALPAVLAHADLPYAVFGHSMGALVAFELALALEESAPVPPTALFVSARRPPDEPDEHSPVHPLPEAQFVAELQSRYGAIPEVLLQERELLQLLLPTLRADIEAVETYAPSTTRKLRCPVFVYGGMDDRHPRRAQLAGWQRVAARDVRVRVFAGDHFYLNAQRDALTADIAARWSDAGEPAVAR